MRSIFTTVFVSLVLAGCGHPGKPLCESAIEVEPSAMFVHAFNVSDSSIDTKNPQLLTSCSVAERAGVASNVFYRYHAETQEAYRCGRVSSVDDTFAQLVPIFRASSQFGTRLDYLLTRVAQDSQGKNHVYLWVYGDGFSETTDQGKLKEAAKLVSGSPIKAIVFVGSKEGSREILKDCLEQSGKPILFLNFADAAEYVRPAVGAKR